MLIFSSEAEVSFCGGANETPGGGMGRFGGTSALYSEGTVGKECKRARCPDGGDSGSYSRGKRRVDRAAPYLNGRMLNPGGPTP